MGEGAAARLILAVPLCAADVKLPDLFHTIFPVLERKIMLMHSHSQKVQVGEVCDKNDPEG